MLGSIAFDHWLMLGKIPDIAIGGLGIGMSMMAMAMLRILVSKRRGG
jgi:hypothetical protein